MLEIKYFLLYEINLTTLGYFIKKLFNDDLVIQNSTYDILGFVKKDEFEPPTIEFLNVKNFEKFKLLISENTITNLDKFNIKSNTFFDSLYEKEYKLDCS